MSRWGELIRHMEDDPACLCGCQDEETDVTRSVEIPEEAVFLAARKAALARWQTGSADTTQMLMSVDAALLAALPYLAPAGDGGLREALTELAKDRDSVSGHDASDYTIRPYELFDLLKAHPAAPAVPQPVDREALAKAIHDAACGCDHYGHMVEIDDREAADIALAAVLAGEQEQVESQQ